MEDEVAQLAQQLLADMVAYAIRQPRLRATYLRVDLGSSTRRGGMVDVNGRGSLASY
jgi:hypothetical protein